jgi:protein-tyrosine phosphatase
MRTEIYWIKGEWPGKLAIFPRPRGGDWLEDEIQDWTSAGLDVIVSLLTEEEAEDLELTMEPALCQSQGLEFISFPITDRSVPASREETLRLASRLAELLREAKNVGIHCRQGVGRASLLATCVLAQLGVDAEAAFDQIGQTRGVAVPETAEQERWVKELTTRSAARVA